MATYKGPVFKEEKFVGNGELLSQLRDAIDELEDKMQATVLMQRGGSRVGWGVSKAQRGIAADSVISIARAIKALKGW